MAYSITSYFYRSCTFYTVIIHSYYYYNILYYMYTLNDTKKLFLKNLRTHQHMLTYFILSMFFRYTIGACYMTRIRREGIKETVNRFWESCRAIACKKLGKTFDFYFQRYYFVIVSRQTESRLLCINILCYDQCCV